MTTERCKGCRFFDNEIYDEDEFMGICRRYPPSIYPEKQDEEFKWLFPEVYMNSWCGEFQPAKQERATETTKTPIREAGISCLLANSLAGGGFSTVEDALARSDKELLGLQNLGTKSLNELRAWQLKNQPAIKPTT